MKIPGALVALIALTSCGDGTGPVCIDDVRIGVGTGLTPPISWSPACQAGELHVEALNGSGAVMWIITSPSSFHDIAPPLTYGTVPAGAAQVSELRPLVAGTPYRASVLALTNVPGLGTRLAVIGSAEFIP